MKTSGGKFLNLAHYFPYDVKLRLLAHSRSFLANQKARNAIVGAENLLRCFSSCGINMLKTKGVQACSKVFWCSSINNFLQKNEFIDLEQLINSDEH